MADKIMDKPAIDEDVIPTSPNWYCSAATSCNNNGTLAFAARNQIFIYDISTKHPRFKDSFQMCKDRITSVCWMRGDPFICAFGGEDGMVRILDTLQRKVVAESKKQNNKISAIVSTNRSIILASDEKGSISLWDYKTSDVSTWVPISAPVFCMSVAPQRESLVAIGYGNGHVLVCDIVKRSIIQQYKSHLDEIHSVVWQPSSTTHGYTGKEYSNDGLFIASGSKDKTIRVWDIEKDNPVLTLNIPGKTLAYKGRRKIDEMNRAKLWITLCWHKKDTLVSSSNSGELLIWDLKTKSSKCISPAHSRIVFNISYDHTAMKIVTTSMDRQIMFWDAETYELLTSMPSLGGYIYSITASYLDPYRIIYGVGDNLIRVWNTRIDDKPYETSLIWQGIKSKVTVVECHPTKESVIGFGTDDGHVGVYNISSGKYQVSVSHHRKTVYSLSWGPHCNDEADSSSLNGNWLYSCGGEGTILAHAMTDLQNKAHDVNTLIKKTNSMQEKLPSRSDVEWRRDFKYLAIGNDDGSVEIFSSPMLQKICTILVHRKIINCMKWHHHFESLEDMTGSAFSSWLATGSSDNCVCVTDLSSVFERNITDKQVTIVKEKFRHFNMHSQRITCLSWSPHSMGLLASSSYDGSVQIWNVIKNEPVANFHSHSGRVLCVLWSLLNPDIVFSGAEDFTLRKWAVSACKHKLPSDMKKSSSQKGNSEKKVRLTLPTPKEEVEMPKGTQRRELDEGGFSVSMQSSNDSVTSKLSNSGEHDRKTDETNQSKAKSDSGIKRIPTKGELKKKKAKSLLPLSSSQNHKQKSASQKECIFLAQYLKDKSSLPVSADEFEPGTNEFVNLGLFGDRVSAFKMFSSEGQNHENSGNVEQQLHLELWKGNLGGALQTCKENGELNAMVVAMSPLGGYDVWQATMQAYGNQLASKGDYITAATYYVAINKVKDAIEMFKAQSMFKEAISLAKVRLPSNNPILIELYQLWGDRQSAEGCNEHAAKCYIASGDHNTAIKTLARKGDINSLKTAAKVALVYEESEIANDYLRQCAKISLTDFNWKGLKEMASMMERSEGIVLQAVTHELLAHCFAGTEFGQALNLELHTVKNGCYINKSALQDTGDVEGSSEYVMESIRFLQVVAGAFNRELGASPSSEIFNSRDLLEMKTDDINLSSAFLAISFEITKGIINLLEHDIKGYFIHMLFAMDILHRTYQLEALEILYRLLFPRDFVTFEQLLRRSLSDVDKTAILQCFHNFHAYFKTSVLFQFWWKRFPYIVMKNRGDVCGDYESVVKENICVHEMLSIPIESEFLKIQSANLVTLIGGMATYILSSLHCKLSQLRIHVKKMEQDILELRIKKQLRMHIMRKKDENKTRKQSALNISSKNIEVKKLSASSDDNWRRKEATNVKNEDDGSRKEAETEDIEYKKMPCLSEDESNISKEACLVGRDMELIDDTSVQLMQKCFEEMKVELEKLTVLIPFHCFPNGLENAKILLHIIWCSLKTGVLSDVRDVTKLFDIADDIIIWGLECSSLSDEKQSFDRFRTKLQVLRS